ncbi:MAG: Crp/Fnr family transcriptional regulator [Jiangellaceae bacterium]
MRLTAVDVQVRAALAVSNLRDLPGDVLDRLLVGAVEVQFPARSVTHWRGEHGQHLELVVAGVLRGFVAAPDGRTMTVRYVRPGGLVGAVSLFSSGFIMPAGVQALVDSVLLRFSPRPVRQAADADIRVAHAFLREISERTVSYVNEIHGSTFATVRQRVARHLLDLAAQHPIGQTRSEVVVTVSQQELADAVGTVREVVVRILRELRAAGVVRTGRDQIVIVDPARLIQEQVWNTSP